MSRALAPIPRRHLKSPGLHAARNCGVRSINDTESRSNPYAIRRWRLNPRLPRNLRARKYERGAIVNQIAMDWGIIFWRGGSRKKAR